MPRWSSFRTFLLIAVALGVAELLAARSMAQAAPNSGITQSDGASSSRGEVETIVILRHGEKPANGNGQLTPQGLNRALALATVLPQRFGKPDVIFAPDPAQKVGDRGGSFYYVRPLATIEPTAIRFEMPVQTPCGASDITALARELTKPPYSHDMVFVAWEHGAAQREAAQLMTMFGGDPSVVPVWAGNDYDSLYIIRITRLPGRAPVASFEHGQEGLNGQSKKMPVCAPR